MNIEVLLTEAEIAQEFAESMQARDLPEKFFYWSPLSVNAWLDLSRAVYEGPSLPPDEIREKLITRFANSGGAIPVISLGAGEGTRDRALLKGLGPAETLRYFPVDASQGLLELACGAADNEDIETRGIKADISSPMHLVLASDVAE